jgi:hypothetical protein
VQQVLRRTPRREKRMWRRLDMLRVQQVTL